MAEGKQRGDWWQTSELMAWIGNVIGAAVQGEKHKSIDPARLNPFSARDERREAEANQTSGSNNETSPFLGE